MKKLLIICGIFLCSACSSLDQASEIEKTPTLDETVTKLEIGLLEQKSAISTLMVFDDVSSITKEEKILYFHRVIGQGNNDDEDKISAELAKAFSQDLPIDKDCLIGDNYGYKNETDECIIARRSPLLKPTLVGYFNYQKYLPVNSIIKTDEQFLELYDAYVNVIKEAMTSRPFSTAIPIGNGFYLTSSHSNIDEYSRSCDKTAKELTSDEKKQCLQDRIDYINNLTIGKAPKCKDIVGEKYAVFRKKELINYSNYSDSKNIKNKNEKLKLFGYSNLCIPDLFKNK